MLARLLRIRLKVGMLEIERLAVIEHVVQSSRSMSEFTCGGGLDDVDVPVCEELGEVWTVSKG